MKTSLGKRVFYSLTDPVGQVFCKDGKIFRLINEDFVEETLLLFKSGLIDELMREGIFPKTSISDITIENYSLVLEHELIPISYPYEWSPSMLKDAALLLININKIAEKYGYFVKDAHPWNILFNGKIPVFVDFGSFIKKDYGIEPDINEFILSFILPLVLFQEGDYYLAHKLLLDNYSPGARVLTSSISRYLKTKVCKYYICRVTFFKIIRFNLSGKFLVLLIKKISKKIKIINKFVKIMNPILCLENRIKKINFPKKTNTMWKNYQEEYKTSEIPYRFAKIIKITNNLQNVKTGLDIAGNQGYLSRLLSNSSKFEKLISMDYDIFAVETAYHLIEENSTKINLIANNFFELTRNKDLIERLRSDVVYGLALTHHLILSQGLKVDIIFEAFNNLSKQYVFIEFMPLGLWGGDNTEKLYVPSWYNVDWFRAEFLHFFCLIEEIHLEKNRILFVGKKSENIK